MNPTNDDLRTIDSRRLREMADGLKADAKALFQHNQPEAMRLFRLFVRMATELHRRHNPAAAYLWN
jgi:hypothetical protein